MSAYFVDLTAINPKREKRHSPPVRAMVDSGSELSWLPREVLAATGIAPRRKRLFKMADGRTMERDVGYCILEAEGFSTNDEVVFAEPGDMHLLGVRTLEGFGVMVDYLAHRLVATATLAVPITSLRPPGFFAAEETPAEYERANRLAELSLDRPE